MESIPILFLLIVLVPLLLPIEQTAKKLANIIFSIRTETVFQIKKYSKFVESVNPKPFIAFNGAVITDSLKFCD